MIRFARQMAALAVVLGAGCVSVGGDGSRGEAREEIVDVLREQVEAWNQGDLDGFMDGYWQSPDLIFTSGARVQRGWQTTLDRYRTAYGDRPETMGRLTFSDLEVHPLDRWSAWVLGRWSLETGQGQRGGVFTLVFQEIDGRWVIVHDHTSESR
ncbi:MAG: YybH family protein [Gemmatimonadota bacterium]